MDRNAVGALSVLSDIRRNFGLHVKQSQGNCIALELDDYLDQYDTDDFTRVRLKSAYQCRREGVTGQVRGKVAIVTALFTPKTRARGDDVAS